MARIFDVVHVRLRASACACMYACVCVGKSVPCLLVLLSQNGRRSAVMPEDEWEDEIWSQEHMFWTLMHLNE